MKENHGGAAAPVIEARGLVAGYGKLTVLRDISLSIPRGGITALCGPNGAGKSTFLKLCLGLLRPRSGSISVLGAAPSQRGWRRTLLKIGYVPQNTAGGSLPVTVREAVAMGRYGIAGLFRPLKKHDYELIDAALENAGAARLAKKQVQELSGGQSQRVAIARALAMEAELLLLDEPTSNLDSQGRVELLRVIQEKQGAFSAGEKLTAVVISHDEGTIAGANKIYRFFEGRIQSEAGASSGTSGAASRGANNDTL